MSSSDYMSTYTVVSFVPNPNGEEAARKNPIITRTLGKIGVAQAAYKMPQDVEDAIERVKSGELASFFCIVKVVNEVFPGEIKGIVILHPLRVVGISDVNFVSADSVNANIQDGTIILNSRDDNPFTGLWILQVAAKREILQQYSGNTIISDMTKDVMKRAEGDAQLASAIGSSEVMLSRISRHP